VNRAPDSRRLLELENVEPGDDHMQPAQCRNATVRVEPVQLALPSLPQLLRDNLAPRRPLSSGAHGGRSNLPAEDGGRGAEALVPHVPGGAGADGGADATAS
jgi:hypothetical protein